MDSHIKTKPSFLEGGLPAASLSAECQRDKVVNYNSVNTFWHYGR